MTNGIRPARLSTHMRSSTARASATSRYISTRSASDSPRLAPRCESLPLVTVIAAGQASCSSPGFLVLEIERLTVHGHGGLADDLREGRVGVGGAADLPGRRFELEAERGLGDQVGRVRPD